MSPVVQAASIAAWNDEAHVVANRELYRAKFAQVTPLLADVLDVRPARRRLLPVGRRAAPPGASPATTSPSRRACSLNTMSRSCPAACWPAKPTGSTPVPAASAWPWWQASTNASKPPTASSPYAETRHMTMTTDLQATIDLAWEHRAKPRSDQRPRDPRGRSTTTIGELNAGRLRVAERARRGQWTVNQWVKKAVLLSFRLNDNKPMRAGELTFFDKVPTKFAHLDEAQLRASRRARGAAGRGAARQLHRKGAVLMPSYVNIGAYVGENTMVDTWATVGSCAQIGKNVHLSGGVGIGGVLEPLQANPTIIEDNCFIGARSARWSRA
jgi:2,3,4,5-tetrahydropyridine-2,6-dicarboxylate N-succinyltransferase